MAHPISRISERQSNGSLVGLCWSYLSASLSDGFAHFLIRSFRFGALAVCDAQKAVEKPDFNLGHYPAAKQMDAWAAG
jgi:hypothetical protein